MEWGMSMYLGFNLDTVKDFSQYKKRGEDIFNQQKNRIQTELERYFYSGTTTINGKKLEEDWFPQVKSNVFLSHSHNDLDEVLGIAGWLYEKFGLIAFIDSSIWGFSNELLRQIDDDYCYDKTNHMYDYNRRNYSTSHVHMMLSMALLKMVDRTEALIFINTPNSISPVSETIQQTTKSPWIYSELVFSNLIRKTQPSRKKYITRESTIFNEAKSLDIAYEVHQYLNNLIELNDKNLDFWLKKHSENVVRGENMHPLDCLYAQFNINSKPLKPVLG